MIGRRELIDRLGTLEAKLINWEYEMGVIRRAMTELRQALGDDGALSARSAYASGGLCDDVTDPADAGVAP